jgi:hypothetical protein
MLSGWNEDEGPSVLGWMSLVHSLMLHVIKAMNLVLIYEWKKNGTIEYKVWRSLYFWNLSLLMIIGIGKRQMRSRAALRHIARKKGKERQRKKMREIKGRKRIRRNRSIAIATITKAEGTDGPVSWTKKL